MLSAGSVQAAVISLVSGNGAIGGADSQVKMLVGSANSAFAAPFSAADFVSASTGPAAIIVSPNAGWVSTLTGYPAAQWVSTSVKGGLNGAGNGGSSALYATIFNVVNAFSSA